MSAVESLRQGLIDRGLLDARSATAAMTPTPRPWFISIVLGCAGWLAGVFALIFVGVIFSPDTAPGFALTGLVLLAAAYGLYAIDRESAFFDQLALALSIAGQLAMAFAAWEATDSAAGTAALVALLQAVLVVALPNRLAKLLSTFFACIAWALAIRFRWWGSYELDGAPEASLLPALIGWLVIWVPIAVSAYLLIEWEARWLTRGLQRFGRPLLSGLLISLAIGTWVSEPFGSLQFWSNSAQTNWLALWPLLATAAALFAATCAFRMRNRALIGVAIAGALLHVAQFYFLLGTTLLVKSAIMLVVGILLSVFATVLEKRARAHE